MFNVTFSKENIANLIAFLERVNLTGKEVSAFSSIVINLNAAKEVKQAKQKKT